MRRFHLVTIVLTGVLAACGGLRSTPLPAPVTAQSSVRAAPDLASHGTIEHVVVIVQENRSVDNLFNGLPGADTVSSGIDSRGRTVTLKPVGLTACYDVQHTHAAFETEIGTANNNFDLVTTYGCRAAADAAFAYVPRSEVKQYWSLAQRYAFADRFFQSNAGPSFPAHQYLLSGTAAIDDHGAYYAMDNPKTPALAKAGGCDSPAGTLVPLIDPFTDDQSRSVFPCFEHLTLPDRLDAAHVRWAYYQPSLSYGLWMAPDAIKHIRYGADYANVKAPNRKILDDVAAGKLPAVSWVIPTAAESDHAGDTDGSGPKWVAQVVNTIGRSKYWNHTVVFVVWDDWGGWYDHVPPQQYNHYELGFRVPFIAISPYARHGYVSHTQHEFGSILHFIEETFAVPSLGYTDARADDLRDMFDWRQSPARYSAVPSELPSAGDAADARMPDDD